MRIKTRLIVKNYEIEERRKAFGYTQKDFVEITGMSITMLQAIEGLRRQPTEDQARIMALELDCDINILFPQGYEKIVDVFEDSVMHRIGDYTPSLLEGTEETMLLEQSNAKMTVKHMMKNVKLSPKERKILILRNGFDGKGVRTLSEVGQEMGVTSCRIGAIEENIHQRIRDENETDDDLIKPLF